MRIRILALLLVVLGFSLVQIATAAPASAASSMAWGTCYITAQSPIVWYVPQISDDGVFGQARISCGTTTTFHYKVDVGSAAAGWAEFYYRDITVPAGQAVYVFSPGFMYYLDSWQPYRSRITFYGNVLVSDWYYV